MVEHRSHIRQGQNDTLLDELRAVLTDEVTSIQHQEYWGDAPPVATAVDRVMVQAALMVSQQEAAQMEAVLLAIADMADNGQSDGALENISFLARNIVSGNGFDRARLNYDRLR